MDSINNLKPEVRKPVRKNNEGKMNRETCRTNLIKFGHELGQTPGDGEGQGSLAYCSPWGWEELGMTW